MLIVKLIRKEIIIRYIIDCLIVIQTVSSNQVNKNKQLNIQLNNYNNNEQSNLRSSLKHNSTNNINNSSNRNNSNSDIKSANNNNTNINDTFLKLEYKIEDLKSKLNLKDQEIM